MTPLVPCGLGANGVEFGLFFGEITGAAVEVNQLINSFNPLDSEEQRSAYLESAFDPEDFYSNHLGTRYTLDDSIDVPDLVDEDTAKKMVDGKPERRRSNLKRVLSTISNALGDIFDIVLSPL